MPLALGIAGGRLGLRPMTLKRRIALVIALGVVVPYLSIAAVSYLTISSIQGRQTQAGIKDGLRLVLLFLENAVRNLGRVSQQLTLDGAVGAMVDEYLAQPNSFERSKLKLAIRNELGVISFTNPNVGLIMYWFGDGSGSRDLENIPVKEGFSPERLPVLAKYSGLTYFGPHMSQDRFSGQYVISALRKVSRPDQSDAYVYLETGFKLTQSVLSGDAEGPGARHLMLDNEGRVAYSEAPEAFPVDAAFLPEATAEQGKARGYYWFRATGNQGWSVVSLIPQGSYDRERNRWLGQAGLLALVFLAFGGALALMLWRMIYRPLGLFGREIGWLETEGPHPVPVPTNIPEFDALLDQFQGMKSRIVELLAEAERREKKRADLEIENLLFQINPHFLMNSLYTIHWLAVEKGQDEIDRLVLALNRLLYYNLGKTGTATTLREEIDSLEEYLILQRTRYDFEYSLELPAGEGALGTAMPRFILQPLVENALLHGLAGSGRVSLRIEESGGGLEILVGDEGPGMDEANLRELSGEGGAEEAAGGAPRRVGMGIGLRYVRRVLDACYGERASLALESAPGRGTRARLRIPAGGIAPLPEGGEA